ncbi:MAG: hypothetical protein Fur0010_00470 [Bdellovibrio sp.]
MLIYELLRILTPEEISELITTGSGKTRVSLMELIQDEIKGEGAKILPFQRSDQLEEENVKIEKPVGSETINEYDIEVSGKCENYLQKLQLQHKKNLKNIFSEKRKVKKIKNNKEISLFIIEEKKKLENASVALKGKEIIQLYEKNSKVDLNMYRKSRENLHRASQQGVLVNKKQA